VTASRFWLALAGSLLLHLAVAVGAWFGRAAAPLITLTAVKAVEHAVDVAPVEPPPSNLGRQGVVEVEDTESHRGRVATNQSHQELPRTHPQSKREPKVMTNMTKAVASVPSSAERPENVALNDPDTAQNVARANAAAGNVAPGQLRAAMLDATGRNESNAAVSGFGSMEMLLKERRLERALTWVFPKVVSSERNYWNWPKGNVGVLRFSVELSEEGRIVETRFEASAGSARLTGLVGRMTQYLKLGRFVLGGTLRDGRIERRFEISVVHRDIAGNSAGNVGNIEKLGFDAPEAGRPGRGYVVDATGQELEARLREISPVIVAVEGSLAP
jgi:hypothetical protein